eukprot:Em0005g1296a
MKVRVMTSLLWGIQELVVCGILLILHCDLPHSKLVAFSLYCWSSPYTVRLVFILLVFYLYCWLLPILLAILLALLSVDMACTSGGCGQSNSSSLKTLQAMPTFQAAPNVTALNAVTALSNPNDLLIHIIGGSKPSASGTLLFLCQCDVVEPLSSEWDHHSLQCPSTQYSFVEAACTTAGCQTGGVANVTTLDSAPVGQAPPSFSISIPLPCPSNGMLPSNPTMSSLPTPCTIGSPALSPSQRCGTSFNGRGLATFSGHMFLCGFINQATVQFHTYNPSGILFYQINSVMTDFLGVKLHGGLPWLIFDNSSVMLSLYVDASVVQSPPVVSNLCDGQGHVVLFEQASNTFYVTVDTVHTAAITAAIVPLLTMKVYFEGFPSTSSRYGIATPYSMFLIPS